MIDIPFIELGAKLIALVGSIFTTYKLLLEVVLNRKPRLREEYKFVKEFLADVTSQSQIHPYLIEKGYRAISGKENLTATEILYLLSQPDPSLALKRYSIARRYVEYSETTQHVNFRSKYSSKKRREKEKIFYSFGYFFSAALAFFPLFFASNLFGRNWLMANEFIFTFLLAFGPLAVLWLFEYSSIVSGEQLVESQQNPN